MHSAVHHLNQIGEPVAVDIGYRRKCWFVRGRLVRQREIVTVLILQIKRNLKT
jgi:hypothetical protein